MAELKQGVAIRNFEVAFIQSPYDLGISTEIYVNLKIYMVLIYLLNLC